MGFKKFIVVLIIIALIYFGISLVLSYSVESFSGLSKLEVMKEMPIYLWDIIKEWVMNI